MSDKLNYIEAIKWFKKAVNNKNPVAMFYLGREYYTGEHIAQDFKQAFSLLLSAAQKNVVDAQIDIGLMYVLGQGMEKPDPVTGYAWIGMAYDQGANYAKKILKDIEQDFGLKNTQKMAAKKLMAALLRKINNK